MYSGARIAGACLGEAVDAAFDPTCRPVGGAHSVKPAPSAATSHYPQTKASREDWIQAALRSLIADGVEQVRILPLAKKLSVSRSSFYWYFKRREDLLNELLRHWQEKNTRSIIERTHRPSQSIDQGVLNIFECWANDKLFDPRLDSAIRDWARRSKPVRKVVQKADEKRVEAVTGLFLRHGYEGSEAFIRARVLYFTQIGYYALGVEESLRQRHTYLAPYLKSFTGQEPRQENIDRFLRAVGTG
ncbi:TetR/AcrR family transcriptional regulator [Hypericibacter terrae]|uniref:TetR/AcrR family transcriptional regulator n=1 Tax=Hypericibacter terrae TaxID=2602015 RepID=UPI001CD9972C|nr:TetR/AcrR family transcriptional regulator [Hypericibacter terrae]